MSELQSEAIVLRVVDFGESDRILHLLTPCAGRITAMAQGAKRSRRRFSGVLDLFHYVSFQGVRSGTSSMLRLEQASLLDAFGELRTELSRFGFGCHFLEMADRLVPEGMAAPDAQPLFDYALSVLRLVEGQTIDLRWYILLQLHSLKAFGLSPLFQRCVRCGREQKLPGGTAPVEGKIAFHVGEGGVVCPDCRRGQEGFLLVHAGTLRSLEQGMSLPLDQLHRLRLGGEVLAEAKEIIERFQHFHLGLELKTESFLEEVLSSDRRRIA